MKIRLNPIVKKDFQVAARSMRLSWGLFAYEALLTLTFILALSIMQSMSSNYYSEGNIYGSLIYMFPALAIAQVGIVALIVPIITSSSISGEKERQTFDIMLTTCMSPFSIVFGKVLSAVLRILFYVAAGLPIMALPFVVGGLSWSSLFYFLLAIILLSLLSGSIGIFCSSICRRSITAVVLSFVFYFVIYILTFIPPLLKSIFGNGEAGESLLFLLFNPFVFFEEFFMLIMSGDSIFGSTSWQTANFPRDEAGILTYLLARGQLWLFVSAACLLLISFMFMFAAAWKVNPMHSASGGKRKKGKKTANEM